MCNGRIVSSSTWYRHNPPEERKKQRLSLPQEVMDAILKLPDTDLLPQTRKRRLDEEARPRISKRTAGSSSVCVALFTRIYAL